MGLGVDRAPPRSTILFGIPTRPVYSWIMDVEKQGERIGKGMGWLARRMGLGGAVREFKKGYGKPIRCEKARRDAERTLHFMQWLAQRLKEYRAKHGSFPRALADLVHRGIIRAKKALAGETDTPETDAQEPTASEESLEADYVYLPPDEGSSDDAILMYEPLDRHEDKGTNVTLVGGQVRWMDRAEFEQRLECTLAHIDKQSPGDD
jgi:hypothetical protein